MNGLRFFKSFSETGLWLCAGAMIISSFILPGQPCFSWCGHLVRMAALSKLGTLSLRLDLFWAACLGLALLRKNWVESNVFVFQDTYVCYCTICWALWASAPGFFCLVLNSCPFVSIASSCLLGRFNVLSASPGHQQHQLVLLTLLSCHISSQTLQTITVFCCGQSTASSGSATTSRGFATIFRGFALSD